MELKTPLSIKLVLQPTEDIVRRVYNTIPNYDEFLQSIAQRFNVSKPTIIYVDADHDLITLNCQEDLVAAFLYAQENSNHFTVKFNIIPSTPVLGTDSIRGEVSRRYAQFAKATPKVCACNSKKYAMSLGYSQEDVDNEPFEVAALSCGNPVGIADLKEGEAVMDLGCGTGFDCRLAAKRVGPHGRVMGIDMTKEMLDRATELTKPEKFPQVSYHQSAIENLEQLPMLKQSFDAVLSNCVFNLSPEKAKVISGVFYVLKPGGRLIFSDPVALRPIPASVRADMSSFTQCMSNASSVEEISQLLANAGFVHISIQVKDDSSSYVNRWTPGTQWEGSLSPSKYIATATISAYKPKESSP